MKYIPIVNAVLCALIAVASLGADNHTAAGGWFVACIGWAACHIEERRNA